VEALRESGGEEEEGDCEGRCALSEVVVVGEEGNEADAADGDGDLEVAHEEDEAEEPADSSYW
jgi:hypothetical protein